MTLSLSLSLSLSFSRFIFALHLPPVSLVSPLCSASLSSRSVYSHANGVVAITVTCSAFNRCRGSFLSHDNVRGHLWPCALITRRSIRSGIEARMIRRSDTSGRGCGPGGRSREQGKFYCCLFGGMKEKERKEKGEEDACKSCWPNGRIACLVSSSSASLARSLHLRLPLYLSYAGTLGTVFRAYCF